MSDWTKVLDKTELARAVDSEPVRGLAFRRILPLAQLLLCAILLWPARGYIFHELHLPSLMYGFPLMLRYGGPLADRYLHWSLDLGMDIVAYLNLPAGIIQLPYAIFSSSHEEWRPGNMDMKVWRSVSWPILGMFFWWIAGRGAEALAASRRKLLVPRITWVETVLGFLLLAGGLAFVIGFLFFAGTDRNDSKLQLVLVFVVLWSFLGSLLVAVKIAQLRLKKHFRLSQSA